MCCTVINLLFKEPLQEYILIIRQEYYKMICLCYFQVEYSFCVTVREQEGEEEKEEEEEEEGEEEDRETVHEQEKRDEQMF